MSLTKTKNCATSREITKSDIRLAKGIAGKLCLKWGGYPNEDIESAAVLGLVVAVSTYDGRGTFRGWLTEKVFQEVVDYFRKSGMPRHALKHGIKAQFQSWGDDLLYLSSDGLENRVIAKDLLAKFSAKTGIDFRDYMTGNRERYFCRSLRNRFKEYLEEVDKRDFPET